MTALVKPLALSAFGVGCLALSSGAQPPAPPEPPAAAPAAPAARGVVTLPPGMPGLAQGAGFASRSGQALAARTFSPFGDDPQARELAKKLVEAKDDEAKEKLRGELKAALNKAFDDRLKSQEEQVADMEKQLRKLKEQVAKRKEARADIVADRLAALEKQAKGLGW